MMLDRSDPRSRGQKIAEVALPAGGVVPLPPSLGGGVVEHSFDPTTKTRRRLSLCSPDGLQHTDNIVGANRTHRHLPHHGESVCLERRPPLPPVLVIPPSGFVGLNMQIGSLPKCPSPPGRRQSLLGGLLTMSQGVDALTKETMKFLAPLTHLSKVNSGRA
jgi:hypothetical protein